MDDSKIDKFDTPSTWLVVFSAARTHRHNRMVPGRFKHVNCIGWLPRVQAWVFYNVGVTESCIFVVPDGPQAVAAVEQWCRDATVVRMAPKKGKRPLWKRLTGFWCVPAVAHMIGSPSGAVLPDTFLRHCLRDGGELVQDAFRHPGPET